MTTATGTRDPASVEVLTPAGDAVRLAPLWARQPIMLALIRHFG